MDCISHIFIWVFASRLATPARRSAGRTSFMIAHRLHTVKHADQIIYMVDGDIKEIGSHRDLIKKDGLYAAMYRSGLPLE